MFAVFWACGSLSMYGKTVKKMFKKWFHRINKSIWVWDNMSVFIFGNDSFNGTGGQNLPLNIHSGGPIVFKWLYYQLSFLSCKVYIPGLKQQNWIVEMRYPSYCFCNVPCRNTSHNWFQFEAKGMYKY